MPDGRGPPPESAAASRLATKTCAVCGRTMTYRPGWARAWATIKYCSDRCRRQPASPLDAAAEDAIRELLASRPRNASICPSEAARLAASRLNLADWRAEMNRVRAAANRLVAAGAVEMTQQGRVVEPSRARGPVRLRLPRSGAA
jgi:hypothetical protein